MKMNEGSSVKWQAEKVDCSCDVMPHDDLSVSPIGNSAVERCAVCSCSNAVLMKDSDN